MATRTGVAERTTNSTPAQNTMPSATRQGMPRLRISVKVKKPLTPIPGATAKGRRAYRPMSRVIVKQSSTVAVRAPLKSMPVPWVDRIEGFTTTM